MSTSRPPTTSLVPIPMATPPASPTKTLNPYFTEAAKLFESKCEIDPAALPRSLRLSLHGVAKERIVEIACTACFLHLAFALQLYKETPSALSMYTSEVGTVFAEDAQSL